MSTDEISTWITRITNFIPNVFPGSQPVNLDGKNAHLLQSNSYLVTYKSDGERAMLFSDGENTFRIDRKFEFRPVKTVPCKGKTLLDGEFVNDTIGGVTVQRYLIYDALYVNDIDVMSYSLVRRLKFFYDGVLKPNSQLDHIYMKDFFEIKDVDTVVQLCERLPHPCDGLIFSPSDEEYKPGRCHSLLKYKEGIKNTVDFAAWKVGNSIELYCSKVGVCNVWVDYADFTCCKYNHFWQSVKNPSIVECEFSNHKSIHVGKWKIVRIREDKSTPNDIKVLHWTYQTLQNTLEYKDLLKIVKVTTLQKQSTSPYILRYDPPMMTS